MPTDVMPSDEVDGSRMDFLAQVLGRPTAVLWSTGALVFDWLCADTWEREGPAMLLERLNWGHRSKDLYRIVWKGHQPRFPRWRAVERGIISRWALGDWILWGPRCDWWRVLTASGHLPGEVQTWDVQAQRPVRDPTCPAEVFEIAAALAAAGAPPRGMVLR